LPLLEDFDDRGKVTAVELDVWRPPADHDQQLG